MDSWFEQWFNTPYYHLLYSHRDADEAEKFTDNLTRELKLKEGSLIIDLACGTGRHSIHLNRNGHRVFGFDICPDTIAEAKKNESEALSFRVKDLREPFEVEDADLAINLFTSFGYFETIEEHLKVLDNIYKALKKKGILVLDFFNAEHVIKGIVPEITLSKDAVIFNIKKYIEGDRIIKEIKVSDNGKSYTFYEKVWLFTKEKLTEMLEESGFEVLNYYGNYDLDHFSSASERLIISAQKNA